MESVNIGKRVWKILRMALLMMRKGLMSKRKLVMDINLMLKRGKLLRRSLSNLIFHHHHHQSHHYSDNYLRRRRSSPRGFNRFRQQDYEFSCSNSPNPVFFHVGKRKHHYLNFPCINTPTVVDDESSEALHREEDMDMAVLVLPQNNNLHNKKQQQQEEKLPDHDSTSPEPGCLHNYSFQFDASTPDLASGEVLSPLLLSPLSIIRISNYSSSEDEEEEENDGSGGGVDDDAEEFIRRFYEELRVQSRSQLLEYEEVKFQEMLARGARR